MRPLRFVVRARAMRLLLREQQYESAHRRPLCCAGVGKSKHRLARRDSATWARSVAAELLTRRLVGIAFVDEESKISALRELAQDRVIDRGARLNFLRDKVRTLEGIEREIVSRRVGTAGARIVSILPSKLRRDGIVLRVFPQRIKLKDKPLAKKWLCVGKKRFGGVDAAC